MAAGGLTVSLLLGGILSYAIYQRYLHPLSRFPGPFWASLTDLWKIQLLRTGEMPARICSLHEKYGNVIRIGPNELVFNDASALDDIYKVGRAMQKGPLYDGFTSFKPNVFGLRAEDQHALRRRQMAHSFSVTALRTMEGIFNTHVQRFCSRVDDYARSGEPCDLKDLISRYQYDLMCHLAFSRSFNSQLDSTVEVPHWNDHFYLGCLYGMVPSLLPYSMRLSKYIPSEWFQSLVRSRGGMRQKTVEAVDEGLQASEITSDRSLLSYVVEAHDPNSGEKLSKSDIYTEAFGFLVAGSHTTSSTITLLLSQLLDNPQTLKDLVSELDNVLPVLADDEVYEFSGMEAKLPITQASIRETHRMTPVVSIPLSRQVVPAEGRTIGGHHLPQGTLVSVTSTALHHNKDIFGSDHDVFSPERWVGENAPNANVLFHFGNGHRQCMGKNLATMSIWKLVTTVLKRYKFRLLDESEQTVCESFGLTEHQGPLQVTVAKRVLMSTPHAEA